MHAFLLQGYPSPLHGNKSQNKSQKVRKPETPELHKRLNRTDILAVQQDRNESMEYLNKGTKPTAVIDQITCSLVSSDGLFCRAGGMGENFFVGHWSHGVDAAIKHERTAC